MSSCDCEAAEAWHHEVRRARKAHHCVECRSDIRVGEKHHYVSGIWDGTPDSFRYCSGCYVLRHAYEAHVREARAAEVVARDDARERATVMGDKRALARTHAHEYHRYEYLCDCVQVGGLREALREFCREVHGYDPISGAA